MPGRKSKNKPIKDSGSSGPDRDKSSGSKKSERTKSRDKIARKPSKELLRIQNYTDSSDEDFNLMTRKEMISRRSNSNSNESPYNNNNNNNSNSNQDRKEERLVTDGGASSKTDIASSLSPSSSKRSPNISRHSKNSHSPKKSSRKTRQSPETLRRKTPPPPTSKSLNMQIKDFIKHSSPPRARKISESSNSQFDAFNHTSSSKLSHASFKEHERSPCSKQSSLSQQYSGQYSENYEDYEYYHPRRSSKEVLDFTSSRKSLQEGKSSENEQVPFAKQHSHEEKNHKAEDIYYKRKDDPHRHCQCPSPRRESSKSFGDVPSPSLGRDEKEVFDFTSKKMSHYAGGTLTRRQRSKDSKNDAKQRQRTLDSEIYSSPTSIKTSRKQKDDRNMFDFSAADGSEYATLRKKRCSSHKKHHSRDRELVSDCSRDYEKIGDVLDFTSSSDRRDVLEFSSATRVGNSSINNSQELLNVKSSTEFLSKSSSKEFSQRRQISDAVHDKSIDPWPESSTLSLPRQHKERDSRNKDYDSLGESPGNSKDDLNMKESLRDATIEPPDLFNTNKAVGHQNSTNPEDEIMLDHSKNYPDIPMHLYQSKIDSEEPIYVSRSGTLKKRFESKSINLYN